MPNKTILLVEDDPMNMRLAQHILESQGYTVFGANTGWEALDQIKPGLPDLILMDMQLPDIDGMTLGRIIRANEAARERYPRSDGFRHERGPGKDNKNRLQRLHLQTHQR